MMQRPRGRDDVTIEVMSREQRGAEGGGGGAEWRRAYGIGTAEGATDGGSTENSILHEATNEELQSWTVSTSQSLSTRQCR